MIRTVRLSDVANVSWGNTSLTKAAYTNTGYPAFSATGADGLLENFAFDGDGIVLSAIGARCGRCFWAGGRWSAIKNTITITSKDRAELSLRYLYFFVNRENAWPSRGGAQPFIGLGDARALEIPLPPLPEQRRIADILDKADAIRRKRKEAIALTEELLRSVFLEMFGDPVTNPKGWEVRPLAELLQDIESGWSPVCLARRAEQNEWGVLKLGALTSGRYVATENKALGPDHQPDPRLEVRSGDVLFARKNTYEHVAACVYVRQTRARLMMSDLVFRLVLLPDSGLAPSVLWAMVSHPSKRREIQSLAGGTAGSMPNISKERLRSVVLPVPPKEVQERFDTAANCLERQREAQIELGFESERMFESLVHRAFRGETLA